jgi:hypothetical protein
MNDKVKKPWADARNWKRIAFMILFGAFSKITEILLVTIAVIQIVVTLITGSRNVRLLKFGGQLSAYVYQIFQYMTYNIEEKPYPFSDWPEYKVSEEATASIAESGEQGGQED